MEKTNLTVWLPCWFSWLLRHPHWWSRLVRWAANQPFSDVCSISLIAWNYYHKGITNRKQKQVGQSGKHMFSICALCNFTYLNDLHVHILLMQILYLKHTSSYHKMCTTSWIKPCTEYLSGTVNTVTHWFICMSWITIKWLNTTLSVGQHNGMPNFQFKLIIYNLDVISYNLPYNEILLYWPLHVHWITQTATIHSLTII